MRYVIFALMAVADITSAQIFDQVPVALYETQTGEKVYVKGRTPETPAVEDKEQLNKLFYQQHLFNIGFAGGLLLAQNGAYDGVIQSGDESIGRSNGEFSLHFEGGVRPPWTFANRLYFGGELNLTGPVNDAPGDLSKPVRVQYGSLSHSLFGEYDVLIISKEKGTALSAGYFQGTANYEVTYGQGSSKSYGRAKEQGVQFRLRGTFVENPSYSGSLYVLAKATTRGVWSLYYGVNAQFGPLFRVTRFKEK